MKKFSENSPTIVMFVLLLTLSRAYGYAYVDTPENNAYPFADVPAQELDFEANNAYPFADVPAQPNNRDQPANPRPPPPGGVPFFP